MILNRFKITDFSFRNDAPRQLWKWSREADYYDSFGNDVHCKLCPHECVLGNNDRGFCRTRVNKDGKLYTIAYGNPCAINIDPIEKKPLFHFLPTTRILSIATAGCNLRCLNCQNWDISQERPEDTRNYDAMPDSVVQEAITQGIPSIAYTYSEPNVWYEYMIDTAKIAKQNGIRNVWVTAGYINQKPLVELCKYVDAGNIDLKAFSDKTYHDLCAGTLKPVLETLRTAVKEGMWVEVTNLVVPNHSDNLEEIREMAKWHKKNLGPDVPLHFSRFHSAYKLTLVSPTPLRTLEEARRIAMDEGLNYVYIGNVPGSEGDNTICPKCSEIVIRREGYSVDFMNFENGKCKKCGNQIAGVWQ
ncbi:AmmeMemoRadiSam system radical SAM enzyme [Candidatus Woesearchaeota archaeon]|nr:AmmeMemoRadiSam system radical SAM enzyme [Candidatus Woesearchaeota archaeon]